MLLSGSYKGTRKRRHARPRALTQIYGIDKFGFVLEGDEMPERDKYFQSNAWLKAKDVKNGQLVIIEEFGEAKTKIGLRPYVKLKGFETPFGLNATNYDSLVAKFGDNDKNWAGKKVKIEIVQAPNPSQGGKMGPAIRLV